MAKQFSKLSSSRGFEIFDKCAGRISCLSFEGRHVLRGRWKECCDDILRIARNIRCWSLSFSWYTAGQNAERFVMERYQTKHESKSWRSARTCEKRRTVLLFCPVFFHIFAVWHASSSSVCFVQRFFGRFCRLPSWSYFRPVGAL